MNKFVVLVGALALAGLSTSAMASGGFVRVEAGRSHNSVDVDEIGRGSDNDTGYSVRGGYYFNDNIAVEGFYSKFYDETLDAGELGDANLQLSAIGLGVVGKKNFGTDGTGFFIMGRTGIARGKVKVAVAGERGSDTSTKPYFGVGAGYDFSRNVGLSLNYDHHKGAGEGVDITAKTLTLGFEYRF